MFGSASEYGRKRKLTERVTVTVKPGVCLPGRMGVRIEDVLVVGVGGDDDQPRISRQTVGGAADYLLKEQTATVAFNDGNPLYVELPASVELTVSQTDPGVQGERSTGGTKPATLETGAQIQVPLFISAGREDQGRHEDRAIPRPQRYRRAPYRREH